MSLKILNFPCFFSIRRPTKTRSSAKRLNKEVSNSVSVTQGKGKVATNSRSGDHAKSNRRDSESKSKPDDSKSKVATSTKTVRTKKKNTVHFATVDGSLASLISLWQDYHQKSR